MPAVRIESSPTGVPHVRDVKLPGSIGLRRAAVASAAVALVAAGFVFGPVAFGQATAPVKVPAAEIYRPTAAPDRIILVPTTTPATTQRVSWRAQADAEFAQAQILAAPIALGDVAPAPGAVKTVKAFSTQSVNTSLGYASTHHAVEFTDLQANTRYTYRVGDGANWSEWTDFTTAASSLQPFSFIYYGDAQNYIDSAVPRVFRQAFADRPQAKVIVNAGDLINSANSEEEWGQWHAADGFINSQVNNISIPGNHEYSGGLSAFWRPQFPYPDNGPGNPEIKQTAYYTDYQGVRFIGLDSNVQGVASLMTAQTQWLEGLLKNNPNKWTVVTFHHPVYSTTGTRNNPNVRNQWGPLFEKYGVDLVLQGHDHSYGRGNKVENRRSVSVHNGVTYAVSVSGGKMYELNGGVNWTGNDAEVRVSGQDMQLYQMVDVSAGEIRFEARYANGEHHDGFIVRKNAKGERTVNDFRTPENTTGEQVTVDKTTVQRRGKIEVSAYGYDPGERVAIYLPQSREARSSHAWSFIGFRQADELGRLKYTLELPSRVQPGTYSVYLHSDNLKITSPVITVTR
jgi:hypothetical protein